MSAANGWVDYSLTRTPKMYTYFDNYNKAAGDADAQSRWAHQLTWEVARHAVGEEIVVCPLFEKYLGHKGAQFAEEDRADHQVSFPTSLLPWIFLFGNLCAYSFSLHRKSRITFTSWRR